MSRQCALAGFSLLEVVISIGVVGVTIPVVMALMVSGGQGAADATKETHGMFLTRAVLEELALAREGQGEFIAGPVAWPDFPSEGERFVFSASRHGKLLARVDREDYEHGSGDPKAAFLISLRGKRHELPSVPGSRDVSKVEIGVETPPGAPSDHRRKSRFLRLVHSDE